MAPKRNHNSWWGTSGRPAEAGGLKLNVVAASPVSTKPTPGWSWSTSQRLNWKFPSRSFIHVASPKQCELLALEKVWILFTRSKLTTLWLRADCLEAATEASNNLLDNGVRSLLVRGVAHRLAGFGFEAHLSSAWFEKAPKCISNVLNAIVINSEINTQK